MANKPLKGVQFPGLEDTYINPIQPGTGTNATIQNDTVDNKATGEYSHAEGKNTQATGKYSHAEGKNTQANGLHAHSEGCNTIAKGDNTHAEGLGGTAYANQSHVEGVSQKNVNVVASTLLADLDEIKKSSLTSAQKSAQTYEKVKATWDALATANKFSIATGAGAHVEGGNGIAHGAQSHVEGLNNVAKGDRAHVEGQNNIALMTDQHVQGRYNVADTTSAHIVGWGSASQPKNIHTLSTSGDAWFAGDVKSGSGKLATESYVEDKLANAGTNSDWSENDENSSSYVKNRTHWIDKTLVFSGEIIEQQNIGQNRVDKTSIYTAFGYCTGKQPCIIEVNDRSYLAMVDSTERYSEDSIAFPLYQFSCQETDYPLAYLECDFEWEEERITTERKDMVYPFDLKIYSIKYVPLNKKFLPKENIYHNELVENESLPRGVTLLPQMPRIFSGTIDPTNETFGNNGDIYIMYEE